MSEKRRVFNSDLKVCNDCADVTSAGRLFHDFVAATGKARLPIVRSRVSGHVNVNYSHNKKALRQFKPLPIIFTIYSSLSTAITTVN